MPEPFGAAGRGIFIDGEEITARGADVDRIRRKTGMVFQNFHLFSHLNVMDNLCLAPVQLLDMKREEAEEKAVQLLKQVGLATKARAFPRALSGGQQQRIAICRALMMEPKLLFFDEPTSALDPTMAGEVLAVIRMLAKRRQTMLIVTHEMHFAREMADRVLFFAEQGIYEQGTPKEIFDSPRKEKTIAFIHKHTFFDYEIRSKSGFDLMELQGGIWRFAEKYGIGVDRAHQIQLCLEELLCEFFQGSFAGRDDVDLDLGITYAQDMDTISIEIKSGGKSYNPFQAGKEEEMDDEEEMAHIGMVLVEKVVKEFSYGIEQGKNSVHLEL